MREKERRGEERMGKGREEGERRGKKQQQKGGERRMEGR